ncbi:DUF4114 domain-containing protein [Anabaena sp. UHCC 0451]|uniref:DUF4114 domain-containing protein n=1 Tax=Anabaena sp. UHCC 0451 TaxID=2055235 RepID=UPI002B1F69FB|nr:DUF4114 domain-containing protein [Anabaena sp. UHCC 0451]MEA5576228.1 DUF4114 domain-containing protein [Anabaena sp. UHCC 0451]
MFDSSLNNQDLSDLSTSIFTTYNGTAYGLSNEVLNPVTNIQNTSAILSLGNELIPPLTNNSLEQKIISADYLIREKFSNLINNPDYNNLLSIVYGVNYQIDLAASLLQTQIHEGFKDVQISVINSEILGNANGAYADSLNTIFLADDFVKNNSTEIIAEVLTEEFGHFLDAQINEIDSAGDEGDIFAKLVFNQSLIPEELNNLKAEDDYGVIYYNNQVINIEKSELEIINNIGETLVINEDTTLVFQWTQREAKYNNEIGIIVFDNPEGKIDGISPQEAGYLQKALNSGKSEVIFAKANSAGNWKQLDLKAGDYLSFYLVQNASTSEYLNNPNSITVFSSITTANTDKFDHVISTNLGKGVYRFNWEDLTGGGDKDFNDVVFNVFEKGFNAGGNNTQTVSLSVEFLSNEAAYKNEIGFYYVDDINGKINGISPTDVNYAREVFKQDNYQVIFGEGNYSGVKEYTLTGGQYIGWYLISNNTSERFLQTNANNNPNGGVVAYFSYAEANPDKLNHLIHYSSNQMGWEDVLGLGDKDYNDIVFNFNFGDPTDINPQTNNPPVADADKTISVEENSQPIALNINPPIDFDGDTLTIMVNQLPDNSKVKITKQNGIQVNINDSLTITELTNLIFTPVADASGNSGSFVYTVSDGKGGSDSQIITFNITTNNIVSVSSINAAPEFVSNPELEIILGENYTYDANAVDEDNDTLFYSLLIAPEGLTIDNNTGVINWQNVTVGNHNISLLVEDGKGGQDRQDYSLNVLETAINRPPVFVSTPVVYGNINTEYRYQALATDADGDSITYSLNQAPLGASIDANTGLITYTPTPLPVGNLTFDTSQNPISPNF